MLILRSEVVLGEIGVKVEKSRTWYCFWINSMLSRCLVEWTDQL